MQQHQFYYVKSLKISQQWSGHHIAQSSDTRQLLVRLMTTIWRRQHAESAANDKNRKYFIWACQHEKSSHEKKNRDFFSTVFHLFISHSLTPSPTCKLSQSERMRTATRSAHRMTFRSCWQQHSSRRAIGSNWIGYSSKKSWINVNSTFWTI